MNQENMPNMVPRSTITTNYGMLAVILALLAGQVDGFAYFKPCTFSYMSLSATSSLYAVENFPQNDKKAISSLTNVQDIPPKELNRIYYYHVTWNNFWKKTKAHFTVCDAPKRKPDFTSSRSTYWDEGEHVVRRSDHWSEQFGIYSIRGCVWTIGQEQTNGARFLVGRCEYAEFERGKRSSMKRRVNSRKKEESPS